MRKTYIQALLPGKKIEEGTFKNLNDFNNKQDVFVIVSNRDEIPECSRDNEKIYINLNMPENINNDDLFCLKDKDRVNEFGSVITAVTDNEDDVSLFWCFNAGKGGNELLLHFLLGNGNFNPVNIPRDKILIGFSDNTILGAFMYHEYGWKMLHAPILSQVIDSYLSKQAESFLIKSISELLHDRSTSVKYDMQLLYCSDVNNILNNPIQDTQIVGGNLTLVQSSIGTDHEIDTKGKILFLEDVLSYDYVLMRSFAEIAQKHIFDEVKAVILGTFNISNTDFDIETRHQRIVDLIKKSGLRKKSDECIGSEITFPIFSLLSIGHNKDNKVLPLYSDDASIHATRDNKGNNSAISYTLSAGIFI